MKKLFFSFLIFVPYFIHAQTWATVGSPGFSMAIISQNAIAIDTGGVPYVAYSDASDSNKLMVMKFNGSSWVAVGSTGFPIGSSCNFSIAIDKGGVPYVAYSDSHDSDKLTVMKYNGTAWAIVGTMGVSNDKVYGIAIAIDSSGLPYVAYEDGTAFEAGGRIIVKKFNGSNWITLDSTGGAVCANGFSPSIAIDGSGIPYVAFQNDNTILPYGGMASVRRFNGSAWEWVGGDVITTDNVYKVSIAIDKNDLPYVAYNLYTESGYAVMKYNGSTWTIVGTSETSASPNDIRVAIDTNNAPYVLLAGNNPIIKKYIDSNWVALGNPTAATSEAYYASMALYRGIPYVIYQDYSAAQKATVRRFDSLFAPIIGQDTVCMGTTTAFNNATTGGIWSSTDTTVALIDSAGVITPVSFGWSIVYYTVSGYSASFNIFIDTLRSVGSLIGNIDTVCGSIHLYNSTYGGTWASMDTTIATITSIGVLTGVARGNANVRYVVANHCGADTAYYSFIIGCAAAVKNIYSITASLSISPNPAHNTFTLNLTTPQTEQASIIITNILGEKIKQFTAITNTNTQIQLDSPPGIYFITAITKDGSMNGKVIME